MSGLRVYAAEECGDDGYPFAWHGSGKNDPTAIKRQVRDSLGNRCLRCGHPYQPGTGEWSPCDEHCDHGGPIRVHFDNQALPFTPDKADNPLAWIGGDHVAAIEARWRVLTVHHLDGVKANCNWWNLVPLCQRDHLIIQRRVVMHRVWPWEHTEWFKPYVAAFYAYEYLGENLTRTETLDRLDELLVVGAEHARAERMPV